MKPDHPLDKAPLAVIILTYQEEENIGACLENVCGWASEVLVVDSFSADRTLEIVRLKGVPVFQNPFQNMAQQRNWALDNLPLRHDWVIFLDADEKLTPELKEELAKTLPVLPADVGGLYIRRRFLWMGRWLKHGGMYKWILRTVRRDGARVEMAGRREYMRVKGRTWRLRHDMIHEDHKGVGDWIQKHNRYATQEAWELLHSFQGQPLTTGWQISAHNPQMSTENQKVIGFRQCWNRFPPFLRPPLGFIIKYFLMLGVLDGLPGLIYYFLHEFWYPFLVDAKFLELRGKLSCPGEKT